MELPFSDSTWSLQLALTIGQALLPRSQCAVGDREGYCSADDEGDTAEQDQ